MVVACQQNLCDYTKQNAKVNSKTVKYLRVGAALPSLTVRSVLCEQCLPVLPSSFYPRLCRRKHLFRSETLVTENAMYFTFYVSI